MKKFAISVLGLLVMGGVLLVPNSASAFRLRNFKNPSMFLGVSRGTPTYGTPFIVWSEDKSANQSFSGSASYVISHAGTNSTIPLLDGVADGAIGDFTSYYPWRQQMIVGYPVNGTYYNKNFWKVDNTVVLQATYSVDGKNVTSNCYRFTNAATLEPGHIAQNLSVAGGNPQPGSAVYVYDNYSDWYNHVDQFWCPVD